MFIGHRNVGFFHIGRSLLYRRDVDISLSFWRRKNVVPGEMAYRVNMAVQFDWPRFQFHYIKEQS